MWDVRRTHLSLGEKNKLRNKYCYINKPLQQQTTNSNNTTDQKKKNQFK